MPLPLQEGSELVDSDRGGVFSDLGAGHGPALDTWTPPQTPMKNNANVRAETKSSQVQRLL